MVLELLPRRSEERYGNGRRHGNNGGMADTSLKLKKHQNPRKAAAKAGAKHGGKAFNVRAAAAGRGPTSKVGGMKARVKAGKSYGKGGPNATTRPAPTDPTAEDVAARRAVARGLFDPA